jgi:hypothetical protein
MALYVKGVLASFSKKKKKDAEMGTWGAILFLIASITRKTMKKEQAPWVLILSTPHMFLFCR